MDHAEALRRARALVVVAGMEGALPSVVGGLVDRPVIAVPTSVGYGASPNQIVEQMARLPGEVIMVRGNHDKVAAGVESGEQFSEIALEAAMWTREALSEGNREYLAGLPQGPLDVDGFLISHGTPPAEAA